MSSDHEVNNFKLAPNFNLKEKLEEFKKEMGITGKVNYTLGGLIPGGLQKPYLYKNNVPCVGLKNPISFSRIIIGFLLV